MREEWRREREDQMKEINKMRRAWRKDREEMRKKMEETEQRLIEAIEVKGMQEWGDGGRREKEEYGGAEREERKGKGSWG